MRILNRREFIGSMAAFIVMAGIAMTRGGRSAAISTPAPVSSIGATDLGPKTPETEPGSTAEAPADRLGRADADLDAEVF